MTTRRPFRAFVYLWAVLQFALPTFAMFADVILERESATAFAHAESRTDSSCRAVHSAECALCQVVHRSSAPSRTAELPPCPQLVQVAQMVVREASHSVDHAGPNGSRAPPLA